MCGNHIKYPFLSGALSGSPPRVREPLAEDDMDNITARITPACAGTTLLCSHVLTSSKDHPRVCGNHSDEDGLRLHGRGSPPRVREPLEKLYSDLADTRITPACAGTTLLHRKIVRVL